MAHGRPRRLRRVESEDVGRARNMHSTRNDVGARSITLVCLSAVYQTMPPTSQPSYSRATLSAHTVIASPAKIPILRPRRLVTLITLPKISTEIIEGKKIFSCNRWNMKRARRKFKCGLGCLYIDSFPRFWHIKNKSLK